MLWRSRLSLALSTPKGPLRVAAWAIACHGLGLETGQSLAPGKQADLIILDRDVFSVDDQALSETQVLKTFFAGKQVYAPDA